VRLTQLLDLLGRQPVVGVWPIESLGLRLLKPSSLLDVPFELMVHPFGHVFMEKLWWIADCGREILLLLRW
jgi:hypothetical protein